MKKTKQSKKVPAFKVDLKLGNETYTSSSDDLQTAILGLKPPKISTRAFFTLEYQGKESKLMANVPRARRILTNATYAFFFGRKLNLLLK